MQRNKCDMRAAMATSLQLQGLNRHTSCCLSQMRKYLLPLWHAASHPQWAPGLHHRLPAPPPCQLQQNLPHQSKVKLFQQLQGHQARLPYFIPSWLYEKHVKQGVASHLLRNDSDAAKF